MLKILWEYKVDLERDVLAETQVGHQHNMQEPVEAQWEHRVGGEAASEEAEKNSKRLD